jgi:DNA-binding CsgD family transcriptional regulator
MLENIAPNHEDAEAMLAEIAPAGYTLTLNVKNLTPQFYVSNYPDLWIEKYTSARYVMFDPVALWSLVNCGRTRWSEINVGFRTTGQRVFEEAKKFGLNFGAACVLRNEKSNRQKCAIFAARTDREFNDSEMQMLEHFLNTTMDRVGAFAGLTEIELETLRDLASGMTHGEIAVLRQISSATVKKRIERARVVLRARNAIHAVSIATKRGLIIEQPLF